MPGRTASTPGGAPTYQTPVFTRHGDRVFVRYIRPYIESARRHRPAAAVPARRVEQGLVGAQADEGVVIG
jgi:hypothetical protein